MTPPLPVTVPVTAVRMSGAAHRAELPLLVLGPSLGTSAATLWTRCAAGLTDAFDVIAWDLPGHGHNHGVTDEPFTMADLAAGVLRVVDDVQEQRGDLGAPFAYAGDSIGGCVGQQLLLDHPGRVSAAALLCTGARLGDEQMWRDRADLVRRAGTPAVVEASARRWFPEGFVEAHPDVAGPLLTALQDAKPAGYAGACEALAVFDVRDCLAEITAPVLAVAGAHDLPAPVDGMRLLAEGVQDGRLVVLEDVGHLAPAEEPGTVARLLRQHFLGESPEPDPGDRPGDRFDAGLVVRREVLGEAHVDRATANATDLTREFQELITEYAWGGIWTRPGLDRRSRSMITLTALIARGHHEELELHLRAARTNGLTDDEIKEVILQSAIYCGVPDANTAFRIAQRVLTELDAEGES